MRRPTLEVIPHPRALTAIDEVLTEAGVPHDRGLTWTTDAFFRETTAKVARRRDQGCITVEMEAAAMFAAATFRGVVYGQLLYAGDDVSAAEWDERSWEPSTRRATACWTLPSTPSSGCHLARALRLLDEEDSCRAAQLDALAGGQVLAFTVLRTTDPQHQVTTRGPMHPGLVVAQLATPT